MNNGVRIKDLQSAEPIANKQFDTFRFPLDAPEPNTTLYITGEKLREILTSAQGAHPLGGRDDLDFKARDLRGATLSLLKSGAEYATMKFEPLVGTGAEPPAPSGGGGTFNYNELTNRPTIGGATLTGDQTLSEYGLWNFGLATQSWVNTRFSSLPAWAMQPAKPQYLFAEITARPTTLGGYGITDGILNTDARLSNARPASDVYAWAKQPTKPSYQYTEIGNLAAASVNYANTSDKSYSTNQLEAYTSDDFVGGSHFIKAIREDPSDWGTRLWMCYKSGTKTSSLIKVGWADTISGYSAAQLWRNDNANLTTVDWRCKKLTLAKFNTAGVATGSVTLTAETF